MLKVSHDTVQTTWRKLESLGLLEYDYLKQPSAEVLAMMEDRPKQHKGWLASVACGWRFPHIEDGFTMAKWMDTYSRPMLRANYTKDDIVSYWEKVREINRNGKVLYQFLANWDTLFRLVEGRTEEARKAGKFTGRNSFGMLVSESRRALLDIDNSIKYTDER